MKGEMGPDIMGGSPLSILPGPTPNLNNPNDLHINGEPTMDQSKLDLNICEMCKKPYAKTLNSHHTIPRYMDGDDEDIIQVCHSCHRRAEVYFERMILDPFRKAGPWFDPVKSRRLIKRYSEKYLRKYYIWGMGCTKGTRYRIYVYYNLKLDSLKIQDGVQYRPPYKQRTLFKLDRLIVHLRYNPNNGKVHVNYWLRKFKKRRMENDTV